MDHSKFIEEFENLSKYYEFSKKAAVLSEYAGCKYPIAVALEYRDALDHIFRCFHKKENIEKSFLDAKNHIIRATYDAYEIIASHYLIELSKVLSGYSIDIVSKVLPTYYSEIRPELIQIQSELAEIRSVDKGQYDHVKCFETYNLRIAKLIEYSKVIDKTIPLINEQQKNEKAKIKKNEFWSWARVFVASILGLIVGFLLKKFT